MKSTIKYELHGTRFVIINFNKNHLTNHFNDDVQTCFSDIFYEASCTLSRYNNWYMRNLDWVKGRYGTNLVIKSEETQDRYGNISFIALNDKVGINDIIALDEQIAIDKLSASINDGINSKGLICSTNIVKNDKDSSNVNIPEFPVGGTNPSATNTMLCSMVCKYLLDKANSVDDAINKFNSINVICPQTADFEYHWLLCDSSKSASIEVINGQVKVISTTDSNVESTYGWKKQNPTKAVLTNFRLYPTQLIGNHMERTNSLNTASPSFIQMYGRGVERYNMSLDIFSSLNNPSFNDIWAVTNDDIEICNPSSKSIKCNRNYKNKTDMSEIGTPYLVWCTDFAGFKDNLKVFSSQNDYDNDIDIENEINKYRLDKSCVNDSAKKILETFNSCVIDMNPTKIKDDSTKYCYKLYILTEKDFIVKTDSSISEEDGSLVIGGSFLNVTKLKYEFELPIQ